MSNKHVSGIPTGCVVKYKHLTPKNSSLKERNGKKWITIAELWEVDGILLGGTPYKLPYCAAASVSYCSQNDNPSRYIGRTIAFNRLMTQYHYEEKDQKLLTEIIHIQH